MLAGYDADEVSEVLGLDLAGAAPPRPAGFGEERSTFIEAYDEPGRPLRQAWRSGAPLTLEQAVEHGLPRKALRRVAERIAGRDKAKISALEWAIVPKTTLDRRDVRLSPPESERTERVARLFVQARRALGSEDEARDYMVTPHPELDGRSPVEATRSDLATRRVERLLAAVEYGLVL